MLNRLLAFIASHKGPLVPADAATHLGVSPALVESMIDQLTDLGYLTAVGGQCPSQGRHACKDCGAACLPAQARLWMLTGKAQAALQARNST